MTNKCRVFVFFQHEGFMYRRKSLILKIYKKIIRSKDLSFVQRDFYNFSKDSDQIIRALRKLVADNILIRIGKGIYAKAKFSNISNSYIPTGGVISAGRQALKKLGIKTYPSVAQQLYNSRTSTQIPTGRVVGVKDRISRKISFNGINLIYEKV